MSQSKRKFHKTVITVTVLSEDPFEWDDLEYVAYAITNGDCSGKIDETDHKVLSAKQAAKALQEQGSDPEFFRINDKGEDI